MLPLAYDLLLDGCVGVFLFELLPRAPPHRLDQ
jgi:hypothetical protein